MIEQLQTMRDFFIDGGNVLVGIFAVSSLLWLLILERYYFFFYSYPRYLRVMVTQWQALPEQHAWRRITIRAGVLADITIALEHNLALIKTLTAVLPLLGLLGTVIGMITIFEVINTFGNSNVRGMAEGISRALLPTTAGLVTSIIGFYFSAHIVQGSQKRLLMAKQLISTEQ